MLACLPTYPLDPAPAIHRRSFCCIHGYPIPTLHCTSENHADQVLSVSRIGVFATLTNSYALVALGASENFYRLVNICCTLQRPSPYLSMSRGLVSLVHEPPLPHLDTYLINAKHLPQYARIQCGLFLQYSTFELIQLTLYMQCLRGRTSGCCPYRPYHHCRYPYHWPSHGW